LPHQNFNMLRRGYIMILLGMMLMLMLNNAFFRHIHVLPDGSLIEHAHPFSGFTGNSNENSHNHSDTEILILDGIFHFYQILIPVVFILIASSGLIIKLNLKHRHDLQYIRSVYCYLLRAPPVC
jgi:hypothetical protein